VLRPECEEPGRSDDLAVAQRHERDLGAGVPSRERLPDEGAPFVSRLWLDDAEPAPRPRVARGKPKALFVVRPQRLEARDTPFERRCRPPLHRARRYTRRVPIYEYACMECESHFEELVRSSDQAVTCPECGAAKVLKQLSSFAVHGAASKPVFSGPAGGGGGCCGGSCGCGH
jgi:putative FmdB family regulatory protein